MCSVVELQLVPVAMSQPQLATVAVGPVEVDHSCSQSVAVDHSCSWYQLQLVTVAVGQLHLVLLQLI